MRGLPGTRSVAALRAVVPVLVLALLPLVVAPAKGVGAQGQFVLRCTYSHTLSDDPIVFPGQPGAAHSHDFFGNVTVNADSTMASMLAGGTTCRVPSDTAGYWTPTASLNGVPIRPTVMRIYYLGAGANSVNVESFPPGLQMIGGNKDATTALENPEVRWSCGETKDVKTPSSKTPYDCSWWADRYAFVDGVIAIVDFPSCWNGTGFDPASVVYPNGGRCPSGYPHLLPRISERVHYGVMDPVNDDGTMALTLSSGPYWSYHADFWNTWQQPRLDQLVEQCIVARVHCGAVDASGEVDWTDQFGTTRYDLAWASATAPDGTYVAGFTNFALAGQRYHHRYDAFVRKYDARGEVRWTRQFGSTGVDQILAVSADDAGVTVVGLTDGRMPKQGGAGGVDVFVARFGPSGRQLWLRQFGTRADDRATAVVGGERPIIAGVTAGGLGARQGGPSDAFLAQLDETGNVVWLRQFGTGAADEALGLALRGDTVYVTGWTGGAMHGQFLGGESDGFVAAFTRAGRARWRRPIATTGTDRVTAIVARANGLFVAGSTDGVLPEQAPAGGLDAFVGKLDPNGRPQWMQQFGSSLGDEAVAVAATAKGVYVAGSANEALPDGQLLGEWDGFVRKYLPNGTQIWTHQLGTDDYDRVYGLSVERSGLYLTGTTHGAFEGYTNAGDRDVFVIRVAFN
ncbi:MAG: DUF1996 domain-containing protein [Actinomycetota bacterium]